jgi:hypothetical protein
LKHSPLFNGNSRGRTFGAEGCDTASTPFRRPPAFPNPINFFRETVGPPEDIGIGRISAAVCRFVVHHISFGLTPRRYSDPILSIIDSAGATTATNDNWETSANLAELKAATAKVTFPPAVGSLDTALLVSLPPGGYSIQIGGVAGAVGNVLIEVYEMP